MCLSIPGKVVEITSKSSPRMGRADFGGVSKEICLEYVPEVALGDYVLVHVGFAISILEEDDALDRLNTIRSIDGLSEAGGAAAAPGGA